MKKTLNIFLKALYIAIFVAIIIDGFYYSLQNKPSGFFIVILGEVYNITWVSGALWGWNLNNWFGLVNRITAPKKRKGQQILDEIERGAKGGWENIDMPLLNGRSIIHTIARSGPGTAYFITKPDTFVDVEKVHNGACLVVFGDLEINKKAPL